MIKIRFMKPFYKKVHKDTLRLVFAYQYFSVMKDEEVFEFIPIEGKEMQIELGTRKVKNLSEVFVFQRGNKFIRLPLYQLLQVSNIHDFLTPIVEEYIGETDASSDKETEPEIKEETIQLIETLERRNIAHLIDHALEERNEQLFYQLLGQKK